jgi:hypothetical protein
VLYSIAESPVKAGVIWTGSTDGQVNVTEDAGRTWTNVTKNIRDLPPWGTIWSIEPSSFEAGTAYIVDNLREGAGDYNPYVYETADYGRTWKFISADIPKSVNSTVQTIVEDPVRKGMLFLGTSNFTYVSWDDGDHWTLLRNNMPPAPISWLTIQKRYNDLVVGTYGRGFWILDDITPLRDWDKAQSAEVYFFKPRAAYRYREVKNARNNMLHNDLQVGDNPPDGADLNYYLRGTAKKVEISIVSASGDKIRTIKGSRETGIQRVWWDLRYEAPTVVELRNSPPGEPWVENGTEGWRPLVHWRNYTHGPKVWPGTYTVKLNVDGKEFSQPLEILRDPKDQGSAQDIMANTKFLLQIRSAMDQSAETINHIEWARKQLGDLQTMLAANSGNASIVQAAKDLEQNMEAVEGRFFPLALTGRTEDAFRVPTTLYGKLANLAFLVESGADLPPTDPSVAVNKDLEQELEEAQQAAKNLTEKVIPAFNATLKEKGVPAGIVP